eukprot:3938427-Rhodomonas_salina.1
MPPPRRPNKLAYSHSRDSSPLPRLLPPSPDCLPHLIRATTDQVTNLRHPGPGPPFTGSDSQGRHSHNGVSACRYAL